MPHTPQQNGVAERAKRTLVEMVLQAGVGDCLWAEAINTASYLRNRAGTSTLPAMTTFESWTKKKPTVSHLKVFGCKTVVLDKIQKRSSPQKARSMFQSFKSLSFV